MHRRQKFHTPAYLCRPDAGTDCGHSHPQCARTASRLSLALRGAVLWRPSRFAGAARVFIPHHRSVARRMCSSRTYSYIRGYAGIHLPMIKASALKSCRKKRSFFYTLIQEKIAAVFLETLDNNRIEPRTKIRYNDITVQREIPLKLPVFCYLFHLL